MASPTPVALYLSSFWQGLTAVPSGSVDTWHLWGSHEPWHMLPRQLRQLRRHDNKTPNIVTAKSMWPAAKTAVQSVEIGGKFKQKLASVDKKRKHMTWDDKKRGQEWASRRRLSLAKANWKRKSFSMLVNTDVFICKAVLSALISDLLATTERRAANP